ncbi:MAG TPA: Lpg1974 family pore-forming outer membrane protein [Lacipirellulaceae bacterium]|nr:Lpg1974 family pore-forming outer membrane protein [Lacipirellulaceae bacterium]
MKLHSWVVSVAALFLAAAATTGEANAQGRAYNVRQVRPAVPAPQMNGGELPMGQAPMGRPPVEMQGPVTYRGGVVDEYQPGGYVTEGGYGPGYGPGCGPEGCGPEGCGPGGCGYGDGCCDTCGSGDCGGECWHRGGFGCDWFGMVCPPGRYFFTADYLHMRASFSEAVAFLVQEDDQQGIATDTFHSFDFDYESSYRLGGGYRLCNCGEEVRMYYTRLKSSADADVPDGAIMPFEVNVPPGGTASARADVDAKSFDLEFAKTIPLGGALGCECGDACGGCGDGCGSGCACPAWDITWSGGVRFADVEWSRGSAAADSTDFVVTESLSAMDFEGGGIKIGLEGRRYFWGNGCLSVYLKGDISLLMGDVDIITARRTDDPTTPTDTDTLIAQTISNRQIIPVTELEAGLTGHITCNTSITTGYMLSAWHDLGFRDEFQGFSNGVAGSLLETNYDDANILGFDGFFARLEVAY